MVGVDLERGEYRRDYQSPQIFAPICKDDTGNKRGQIGKCHDFPYMSGGNDDKEIT